MNRVAFVVVMHLVVGCGSDDGVGGTDAATANLMASCQRYAHAVCTRGAECGRTLEPMSCTRLLLDDCLEHARGPGYDLGGYTAAMDACASLTMSTACALWAPICESPKGTLPIGGACEYDSGCATGYCERTGDGCGTCKADPTMCKRAEHCGPTEGCEYVDGDTGPWYGGRCVPGAAVDERCEDKPCRAGLYCHYSSVLEVCVPLRTRGQPCTFAGACVDGLACVDSTCQPPPPQRATGEACIIRKEQCTDGYCDDRLNGGTCVHFLEDDEACEFGNDARQCRPAHSCEAGVCVDPPQPLYCQ